MDETERMIGTEKSKISFNLPFIPSGLALK